MVRETRGIAEYYTSWAVLRSPDDIERILASLTTLSVVRFAPDIRTHIFTAHRATHRGPAQPAQYASTPTGFK